ncbi:MAG: DUF6682 family protein [Burkholderiales bacterium]
MASSILVRDAIFRVSSQLHDISPQFTRWTQRELVSWLNDGQKAIAKYMPASCTRVDVIKLTPGTKQSIESIQSANIKPGDGSAAANVFGHFLQAVMRNMGADGTSAGRAIRLVDREVLDVNSPDWHSVADPVVSQWIFDPRFPKVFYVSPGVPATPAVWVEVSFLANPVEVLTSGSYGMDGSDTTKISVDDKYIDDLVNYILARAYMKDAEFAGNANMAAAHTSMFTGSINAQVAALTGINPNLQSLPLNPNTAMPHQATPVARG